MYKFTITNGYLNIQNTENNNQVLNVPRAIVASNLLELYSLIPAACLYNSFCDNQNIFRKPLSECVDSTDTPFTADSFTEFCQTNLGFNTPGATGEITVVTNYSALPDPTTVPEEFYWCEQEQGFKWLPGSLGGTYYNSGLYYSNGVSWTYMNVPYQATQSEVDAGINDNKFVTPLTLKNSPPNTQTQTALDSKTNELISNVIDVSTVANFTQQILSSYEILSGKLKTQSLVQFSARYNRIGNNANVTIRHYLAPIQNSLVGAILIQTYVLANTNSLPCLKREFSIDSSNVFGGMSAIQNSVTDEIASPTALNPQSATTIVIPQTYYLTSTVQLNSLSDTIIEKSVHLTSSK